MSKTRSTWCNSGQTKSKSTKNDICSHGCRFRFLFPTQNTTKKQKNTIEPRPKPPETTPQTKPKGSFTRKTSKKKRKKKKKNTVFNRKTSKNHRRTRGFQRLVGEPTEVPAEHGLPGPSFLRYRHHWIHISGRMDGWWMMLRFWCFFWGGGEFWIFLVFWGNVLFFFSNLRFGICLFFWDLSFASAWQLKKGSCRQQLSSCSLATWLKAQLRIWLAKRAARLASSLTSRLSPSNWASSLACSVVSSWARKILLSPAAQLIFWRWTWWKITKPYRMGRWIGFLSFPCFKESTQGAYHGTCCLALFFEPSIPRPCNSTRATLDRAWNVHLCEHICPWTCGDIGRSHPKASGPCSPAQRLQRAGKNF